MTSAHFVVSVPSGTPDATVTYLKGLGLSVAADQVGKRTNPHIVAAVERLVSERAMLLDLVATHGRGAVCVDVYSNAVRMVDSAAFLGCEVSIVPLIPAIVPNDRHRQIQATRAGIAFHDVLLPAFQPQYTVDALNFTHSLYYIQPEELVAEMVRLRVDHAYSTQHNFTSASASICGGSVKYHYATDGSIVCKALGEDHVYTHGAMHWLFGPPLEFCIDGKAHHLFWHVHHKIGDTLLYKFEVRPGAPTTPHGHLTELTITDTKDEDDHPIGRSLAFSTFLDKEMRSPTVDITYVPVKGAFFFFGLVGVELGNGEFLAVPRGLVGTLALAAAGEPRTPALYQLLLAKAKANLGKLNYPSDLAPRVAIYATVMALIVHVEYETVALGTANRLFARLFYKHQRVLDFEPVYLVGTRTALAGAAFASTVVVPAHYYGVDMAAATLCKAAVLVALAHPFIAVPTTAVVAGISYWSVARLNTHRSAEALQWVRYRANLMPGPVGKTLHFTAPPAFAGASEPKTPPAPLARGASLIQTTDQHGPDVRALTYRGLKLHGVGFQDATPSYVARTMGNARQGLESRSLSASPDYDPTEWFTIYQLITDESKGSFCNRFILGPLRNYNEGTFEAWVKRFPTNVEKRLREAKASLVAEPLVKEDLKVSGIVKMEKAGMLTVEGEAPLIDTRMVMSCTPRANAFLGPFLWSMGCVFKKRFGFTLEPTVVWDSGLSAEELGELHDHHVAAFSRPGKPARVLVFDRKRFEKHQRAHAQTASDLVIRGAGADNFFVAANRKLHILDGKVQGMPLTFRTDEPTQVSGGNDTAWRNFFLNCVATVRALRADPGPTTWSGVIKGDDGLVYLHPDFELEWSTFESRSASLGLPVTGTLTTNMAEVEFASNLPYPSADGTVFGPKIGRTLLRFGWTLSNAPADVYGAATSLLKTTNHIPFLRQFIETHRRLAKPQSEVKDYFKYKTLANEAHESCPATYAFIQERYGLTPALEVSFTELLATVNSLPATLPWQMVSTLVEIDE